MTTPTATETLYAKRRFAVALGTYNSREEAAEALAEAERTWSDAPTLLFVHGSHGAWGHRPIGGMERVESAW